MKKSKIPKGESAPGAGTLPSEETVIKWVRKDMESAHYLLGIILERHPKIVEEMARDVYRTVMAKENGAAIDHVAKDHAQTGLD